MAALLPPPEEQAWLLGALGDLNRALGARHFLEAPLLTPDGQAFPDPFTPDAAGVETLLRRLLQYAGLKSLDVDVQTYDNPDVVDELDETGRPKRWRHEGAAAWFAGLERGTAFFGVDEANLGDPATLVGTLCHEVAHAFRAHHKIALGDADEEERLTDVTTIYLGFGILTTNASYRYRSEGGLDGVFAVTQWSHQRVGYLAPEAMSFLLAAQATARGLRGRELRQLGGRLHTNQAGFFRAACGVLAAQRDLARTLDLPGIAPQRLVPVAAPVPLPPKLRVVRPDDAQPQGPRPAPDDIRGLNIGRRTFRIRRTRAVPFGALGAALAVLLVVLLRARVGFRLALLLGAAAFVVCLVIGLRRRWDYCSDPDCRADLAPDATVCPRCGGTISGTLSHPNERLEAEERLRRRDGDTADGEADAGEADDDDDPPEDDGSAPRRRP